MTQKPCSCKVMSNVHNTATQIKIFSNRSRLWKWQVYSINQLRFLHWHSQHEKYFFLLFWYVYNVDVILFNNWVRAVYDLISDLILKHNRTARDNECNKNKNFLIKQVFRECPHINRYRITNCVRPNVDLLIPAPINYKIYLISVQQLL
jgi:hypothetical protein